MSSGIDWYGVCMLCYGQMDMEGDTPKRPYRDAKGDRWDACHECHDREVEQLELAVQGKNVQIALLISQVEDLAHENIELNERLA